MRLSSLQKDSILQTLQKSANHDLKIYLFGSRVRDDLRGGDIDLLIVCPSVEGAQELRSSSIEMSVLLKASVEDRKFDLYITSEEEMVDDPFVASIIDQAILLKR